jgi:hypothetical protein
MTCSRTIDVGDCKGSARSMIGVLAGWGGLYRVAICVAYPSTHVIRAHRRLS